jgi:hypothetical protein
LFSPSDNSGTEFRRSGGWKRCSALCRACVQSVGHLAPQVLDLFDIERLASDEVPERLSLQQLHSDEVLTVRFFDLVNRADVGVIERGSSESLQLEAFASSGIVLQLFRREL